MKADLAGPTFDIFPAVGESDIMSTDGNGEIFSAVFIFDSLSVTNQLFQDLNQFLLAIIGPIESYPSHESNFAA